MFSLVVGPAFTGQAPAAIAKISAMPCIFCDMVSGKLPSSIIYESEHILSFMILDQPNPFKALVIPKIHIESIFDMPEEIASKLFKTAVKISKAIKEASNCDGLNIVQSNSAAGQQDVFHFHMHILPRWDDDEIILHWDCTPHKRTELDALCAKIGDKINK